MIRENSRYTPGRPIGSSGPDFALLTACDLAAYLNSFDGKFLFDDFPSTLHSAEVRQVWPRPISPRLFWQLTLALNLRYGGEGPLGVPPGQSGDSCGGSSHPLRTCAQNVEAAEVQRTIRHFGRLFAFAAIWLVHPLTTQAVTYIVQRGEAMMALAFLFCLYAVVRGTIGERGWLWYLVAALAFWIGMGCKEPMAMAPLVVALFDRVFLAQICEQ